MNSKASPISGRNLEKRWKSKGLEANDIVLFNLINAFDLLANDDETGQQIIIDGSEDSKDYILAVHDYYFDLNTVEQLENQGNDFLKRLILNYNPDNDAGIIPDSFDPKELLNLYKRRLKNINTTLAMGNLGSQQESYLARKEADIEKKISRLEKIISDSRNLAFPCKPRTKWENIKITLLSETTARIETPQGTCVCSYHELGMADNRTRDKKPGLLWELLRLFAKYQGFISSKNPKYDPKLPDTAKRLNKHLQELFGIDDQLYTGHYKSQKGYKTKIFFSDQTQIV
jgi:hypothetical protein